tara:strand:+ start:171 stop:1400 length:1230 start_codon:yes stop_codon:yes gene_type:complete
MIKNNLIMTQNKLKNFIINLISIIFAVFLCLFVANFVFIKISNQKSFPRSLSGSLPNILLVFHPDTYKNNNLKNYTAILGGSYAQGGGDAYLSGIYDYSVAHHLHKQDKKNYLNFARAGYGSISAVSNLINMYRISNSSNFINDLNKPDSVIFFFNEGHVLDANFREFSLFSKQDSDIEKFVINRFNENLKINSFDKLTNNFPLLFFFTKFYYHIENLFKKIIHEPKKIIFFITNSFKKLFGYTIVLQTPGDLKKGKNTFTNSVKNREDVKNIQPLQAAAPILTKEEILISLNIFFESIKYMKKWGELDKIYIVYIPSPVTLYDWSDPINYEVPGDSKIGTTTKEKNNINNKFITDKISEFSTKNNIQFLNTTQHLYELAKSKKIHGPLDWSHLNYHGYKDISNYILNK